MHFLVVGSGSIGQRHIRNLKLLGHKVSVCENNRVRAEKAKNKYSVRAFYSLAEALKYDYNGALICTPTRSHIPIALKVAVKRIHLFIEKPLSDSLKGMEELSGLVNKFRLKVLVGCNTKFLPSFKFAKKLIEKGAIGKVLSVRVQCGFYLPYWHPYEDYRKGYSANSKLGGGVILDDIHEIDSLRWLFGQVSEVFCFKGKVSSLRIDTEDIAEIFLRFKSGTVAQAHLDYLQRTYRRDYEFIGEKGVLLWDYISQNIELYGKDVNRKKVFQESINTSLDSMFLDEMKHFVNCIKGKEESVSNLENGRKTLEVALACFASANKKMAVLL